ncbi:MAG: multidrug efflux MFS transporter, partial [Mesorhizobium sp.]
VTPFNPAFGDPAIAQALSPYTAAGRAALDGLVTLQATIISYVDDFELMMLLSLAAIPLVLLLRKPGTPAKVDHSAVME